MGSGTAANPSHVRTVWEVTPNAAATALTDPSSPRKYKQASALSCADKSRRWMFSLKEKRVALNPLKWL